MKKHTFTALSTLEAAAGLGTVAFAVMVLTRRLSSIAKHVVKIASGVRAIDTQARAVEPGVNDINLALERIRDTLADGTAGAGTQETRG